MLAQRQNDWESGEYEWEHGTQVHLSTGGAGSYHHRTTTVITKSSGWRNGNLLFTVSPIGEVIDEYYDQQMAVLEQTAARQRARRKAEKSGVEFVPPGKEQSA